MTLKSNSGNWSLNKLALLFTVLGGIAMMVECAPTFFSYCHAALAPWNSLPELNAKITAIQEDVSAIKHHLQIKTQDYQQSERRNTNESNYVENLK